MSVAKRRRGESSRMRTHLGVGEPSTGANRPAFGRNVYGRNAQWAKRPVTAHTYNVLAVSSFFAVLRQLRKTFQTLVIVTQLTRFLAYRVRACVRVTPLIAD